MEALSRCIVAHLHSDAFDSGKPTPKLLLEEIEAFDEIRKRQRDLKKAQAARAVAKSPAGSN